MKKIFTTFLLLIMICTSSVQAKTTTPNHYTNIFKSGQYKVNNNGDLIPGEYEISLITPDAINYIYIIDKDCIQRYSKRFDSTNMVSKDKGDSSLISSGILLEGDTIIIYGNGEIYINSINNKKSN